jgi:hypothetical protein
MIQREAYPEAIAEAEAEAAHIPGALVLAAVVAGAVAAVQGMLYILCVAVSVHGGGKLEPYGIVEQVQHQIWAENIARPAILICIFYFPFGAYTVWLRKSIPFAVFAKHKCSSA